MLSRLNCIKPFLWFNFSNIDFFAQVIHGNKLPVYENEALTVTKKDNKYYKTLYKQSSWWKITIGWSSCKPEFQKSSFSSKCPSCRCFSSWICVYSCSRRPYFRFSPPPSAKSFDEYVTVSPADVALFAVGSHVSIISDTSQRGYKSNRVFGKVTAVYLSADGTYLYDVHKIIDGYTRLRVKQSELEYLHGYSSNDWEGSVLEPRQGSENTRSQLKREGVFW